MILFLAIYEGRENVMHASYSETEIFRIKGFRGQVLEAFKSEHTK